jgi:hypothetical protein
MVLACAKLHAREGCRHAYEEMADRSIPPFGKLRQLVDACSRDYCADLSPPPSLCARDPAPDLVPTALAQMWGELEDAILRHDLGSRTEPMFAARERAKRKVEAALERYYEAGSPPYRVDTPETSP